jgi:hypothetical protein
LAGGITGNAYKIQVGIHNVRDYSENLSVDGRIILKRILGKYGGKLWIEITCLRIGAGGGLF